MALLDFLPGWGKFLVLYIPFLVLVWFMAPSLKWKFLFTICGAAGIWLALAGKSMKGVTPVGRRI